MKMFPETLTDEAFVECVRERLRRSKWRALIEALIGIAAWGAFFLMVNYIFKVVDAGVFDTQALPDGLRIGIAIGTVMALALVLGVVQLAQAFAILVGSRITKLMLKYHDHIKTIEQPTDSADGRK